MPSLALLLTILLLSVNRALAAECPETDWECESKNQCVNSAVLCDGLKNCQDGSDENFHLCSNNTCPEYAFRCAYGACVDAESTCNGVSDCRDKSDELLHTCPGVVTTPAEHNCKELEFPCMSNSKCIGNHLVCDGQVDCEDASDETIIQCRNFSCPEYAFRCAYGACVDGDAVCDGKEECADGSDEYAPQCDKSDPKPIEAPVGLPNGPTGPRNAVCHLPPPPEHGTYTSYYCEQGSSLPQCRAVTGTPVQIGFDLHHQCFNGYTIRGNPEQYCRPGGWSPPDTPTCSDECEPVVSSRLKLICFKADLTPIPCDRKMPARSFVRFQCRQATYVKVKEPGYNRLTCVNGEWDRPFTDDFCQPACGRAVLKLAELFISNGTVASYGSFPWHAGIYEFKNQSNSWSLNCGGSLVSRNLVVTAAHCFMQELFEERKLVQRDISLMKIVLGKRYRSIDNPEDTFAQIFEIEKLISNPDYTGSKDNYAYDIALVILSRPVEYTVAVLPVCLDLGRDNIEEDQLVSGAVGMVAGWGVTEDSTPSEQLLVAHMPFVPRDVCLKSSNLYTFVTKDKLCAGDPKSTTNVCKGDSGGGFVFEDKQTRAYYLRGVVSLGDQGCTGQDYALFTKLSKHTAFINKYL